MTNDSHNLLLVTRDATTARRVRELAEGQSALPVPTVVEHLDSMMNALAARQTGVAVIDIDDAPDAMLNDLEPIITRYSETRFVVLAGEIRQEWLLHAMQVGARHFVAKQDIEDSLPQVVARLLPDDAAAGDGIGNAVAVLGAGGGCGATMLALNLAAEMHEATGGDALLIDLDTVYGGLGRQLAVSTSFGVGDVLMRTDQLDAQLLQSSAVELGSGLHLLASPATVDFDHRHGFEPRNVSRMVRKARTAFAHVVIDGGRSTLDTATQLASTTDRMMLVFELNVMQVRHARAMLRGLLGRDVDPAMIIPVANRYRGRKEPISIREAAKALDVQHIETLPNDHVAVSDSINYGKPLAAGAARSDLRRAIEDLARRLMPQSAVRKSA